jgi:hypothetical protein
MFDYCPISLFTHIGGAMMHTSIAILNAKFGEKAMKNYWVWLARLTMGINRQLSPNYGRK